MQKTKNFHYKRVESISGEEIFQNPPQGWGMCEANPFFVGVWMCFSGTKQNIILLVNIKVIHHIASYKFVFYSFVYLFNKIDCFHLLLIKFKII